MKYDFFGTSKCGNKGQTFDGFRYGDVLSLCIARWVVDFSSISEIRLCEKHSGPQILMTLSYLSGDVDIHRDYEKIELLNPELDMAKEGAKTEALRLIAKAHELIDCERDQREAFNGIPYRNRLGRVALKIGEALNYLRVMPNDPELKNYLVTLEELYRKLIDE